MMIIWREMISTELGRYFHYGLSIPPSFPPCLCHLILMRSAAALLFTWPFPADNFCFHIRAMRMVSWDVWSCPVIKASELVKKSNLHSSLRHFFLFILLCSVSCISWSVSIIETVTQTILFVLYAHICHKNEEKGIEESSINNAISSCQMSCDVGDS